MAEKQEEGPRRSEVSIKEWLEQIGATEIRYVGDGDGPPDFLTKYADEEIAVEVTCLHDSEGWSTTEERAFERELKRLIEEVLMEDVNAPRWHSTCEYDPREPRPPKPSCEEWKEKARKALRTRGPGGEFQLLSPERIQGRGVRLELIAANNEGSFAGVRVDEGHEVGPVLARRIVARVKEKASKVQKRKRLRTIGRWWLVFDDEILRAPIGLLGADERTDIEAKVRECCDREQWSKIVLISRFQTTLPPLNRPKRFYAPWEDPKHPALPVSP